MLSITAQTSSRPLAKSFPTTGEKFAIAIPLRNENHNAEMRGRRIPVPESNRRGIALERPGDYCGPVIGFTGSHKLPDGRLVPTEAVIFLKPNARDPDAPMPARNHMHVCSPPHTFTEEPDGTLTITPSISHVDSKGENDDGWHGHLTKGEWIKS